MAIPQIKKDRLKKLDGVRKAGQNPYPSKTERTHSAERALADFSNLSRAGTKVVLAGRIVSLRQHGGSAFLHLKDGTGSLQAYFKKDLLGEKKYRFFLENFDLADFIQVSGTLFETKRGEKTLEVSDFKMLAKALLPLPEKWHGLKDAEERFRKRYLDLIMNPEVREKFQTRSRMVKELRSLLSEEGFTEVETPILQPIPGGALAKPFKTHLNSMNMDLYLRVAPELYLKRLLIGGFEKIYEIGRCFRNEGMDKHHNPDFTMIELYWAFKSRDDLMDLLERIVPELVFSVKKKKEIEYQGQKIDFKPPWPRVKFNDLVKKHSGLDIRKASEKDLRKKLSDLGVKVEKEAYKCALFDELYKKACRPNLIRPTFVVDHPVEMAVLAKAKKEDAMQADRFQLVVGGIELINGFSELNDPEEQKKRFDFKKIASERRDKDFLQAMEHGMPPAAGLGMGIDRLAALLTDSRSLREIILFPTMKQKK